MREFYVYVYLNPLNPGKYQYQDFCFEFEPFYVGKGRNERHQIHVNKVKRNNYGNHPKYHKIKEIIDFGMEPIIIKVAQDLLEDDSFLLEKKLIKSIGRKDLSQGPLTNLTDGGEGNSGRKWTDEQKKNLSVSRTGFTSDKIKENLKRIHSRMIGNQRTLGMKFSEESKKKISESHMKIVLQINFSGEIVNTFKSIKDAENSIGVSIKKALRGEGKTAGGFIWKYEDPDENFKIDLKVKNKPKKERPKITKKIAMLNLNYEIIKEYDSITDAFLDTGISVGNISKNLTGKGKTAGGFIWRYK
jgi:hypothetical protein